ncbi:MAG TPA: hypothetical protein RMH99_29585 [Sandaracinaceae bacterium LLY-WYZ-13_1]|nr:hypothetical protein [Sandaracinaceae bacterium LLY-WYZ-13_1]
MRRLRRIGRSLGALLALAALLGACGGSGLRRFALRPPLWDDPDDRPFAPPPAEDEEPEITNAIDAALLGPTARAFRFEVGGEAHDVNALGEVPDSTWFTDRRVSPADLARGPCPAEGPTPPFHVDTSKRGGDTPGFVVEDANGRRYVFKVDPPAHPGLEITTAADAVVSRLYWAAGFHVPCNDVIYAHPEDFVVDGDSSERGRFGARRPLTRGRFEQALSVATHRPDGAARLLASLFIEGRPIGTWRAEGVRADDPNDVIPHEDRRELRGERYLAAWVSHWDSRGPNTFDAYVPAPGGGGYVVHHFLDFGDCLGTRPARSRRPEPRPGFTTIANAPNILADFLAFGFVRRPWDEVRIDPRYPNLGFFDVAHFEPNDFAPQTPLLRWARATPRDRAWMARRIARLGRAHVRAAARAGRLSDPDEEARLVEVLMGRRERILRAAFAETTPLADLASGERRFCATDLLVATGLSDPDGVDWEATLRVGARQRPLSLPGAVTAEASGRVCAPLPPSFAPADAPDESDARYAVLELARREGGRRTVLRAHFYDLGPARGYALVGAERP